MTRSFRFAVSVALFLLIVISLPASARAQAGRPAETGYPPFGSFAAAGGAPDTVNLGNLNVHLSIPILHKSGRGLPFNFDLAYDSTVWFNLNGQWEPNQTMGWSVASSAGYITYVSTGGTYCTDTSGNILETQTVESDFVYYDGSNTPHVFDSNPPNLQHSYVQGIASPLCQPPQPLLPIS